MGASEYRWYYVDTFVASSTGARSRRGPFRCERVPMDGTTAVPGNGGELVTVEERVYLPAASGVRARSVLVDAATNVAYEVLYIQRWMPRIEAWVKRSMPD